MLACLCLGLVCNVSMQRAPAQDCARGQVRHPVRLRRPSPRFHIAWCKGAATQHARSSSALCDDLWRLCHSQVILSAPSDDLRNLWVMAMSLAGVTRSFRFWAKKMGHAIKNWRRRFFLVHAGLCYYFENENDPVAKVRHAPGYTPEPASCLYFCMCELLLTSCDFLPPLTGRGTADGRHDQHAGDRRPAVHGGENHS